MIVYVDCILTHGQIADLVDRYNSMSTCILMLDLKCFSGARDANVTIPMTEKASDDFEFGRSSFITIPHTLMRTMSKTQFKLSWEKILNIASKHKYQLAYLGYPKSVITNTVAYETELDKITSI